MTRFARPGDVECRYRLQGGTATDKPLDRGPELSCDRRDPNYVRPVLPPRSLKRLEPLIATDASAWNLERFIAAFDSRVALAPLPRKLDAPTLNVSGRPAAFFPVKWAYWLHRAVPGACEVVELEGAGSSFRGSERTGSQTRCGVFKKGKQRKGGARPAQGSAAGSLWSGAASG